MDTKVGDACSTPRRWMNCCFSRPWHVAPAVGDVGPKMPQCIVCWNCANESANKSTRIANEDAKHFLIL